MRALVLLFMTVPLLAQADVSAPPSPTTLRAADGHIVDPRDCDYLKATFKPTVEDVRRLERLLPAALEALALTQTRSHGGARGVLRHLAKDRRFYIGVAGGFISVHAHTPWPNEKDDLCPPEIMDGGDSVWRIVFDPKTGKFRAFGTNGYA